MPDYIAVHDYNLDDPGKSKIKVATRIIIYMGTMAAMAAMAAMAGGLPMSSSSRAVLARIFHISHDEAMWAGRQKASAESWYVICAESVTVWVDRFSSDISPRVVAGPGPEGGQREVRESPA